MGFRKFLRWWTYSELFSSPFIDKVTAKCLYDLSLYPKNKDLIVDLMIFMYTQPPFVKDVQGLTQNIISDYLQSKQCKDDF